MNLSINNKITSIKLLTPALSVLLILFCKSNVQAQSNSDLGFRGAVNIEAKLSSKFTFLLTEEIRLKENFKQLNLFNTSGGVEFKINKNIKTVLVYRFTQKSNPDNSFGFAHRLSWDVVLKKKFNKLEISYRHRLQAGVRNVYSSEMGLLPGWYSRNKIQVKYELNKYFTSYCSAEIRYQIREPLKPESNNTLYQTRYKLGMDYTYSTHSTIGAYYFFQNKFNRIDPEYLYVIGLEYTYKF